jgi:Kef-type K+ transport system membrane component KefB
MLYFLAGFTESIGNFLNCFFVPIFLITFVLTAIPLGPDHAARWNAVLLPGLLVAGTWCSGVVCRMIKTGIQVKRAQDRYR